MNSPILNEDEIKNAREQLSGAAGKEEFVWTNFKFDEYQNVVMEESNYNFVNFRFKFIQSCQIHKRITILRI